MACTPMTLVKKADASTINKVRVTIDCDGPFSMEPSLRRIHRKAGRTR